MGKYSGTIKPQITAHYCKQPLTWFLRSGSLWRCIICGWVYRLVRTRVSGPGGMHTRVDWDVMGIEEWTKAGGSI
jgi:predicted Rdx family selenoprotein